MSLASLGVPDSAFIISHAGLTAWGDCLQIDKPC